MKLPKFTDKDWFNVAVIVCIGVTLFVLLSNISSVIAVLARFIGFFRPVILGVIIAYIISPLAKMFFYRVFRRIEHRKVRWYLSVYLSFALLLIAFFLLVGLLLPQLVRSIVTFSQNFDSYTKSLKQLIENSPLKTIIDEENMELINQNVMTAISGYVKEAADNAISIAASAGKNIISTVIGLILAVYLLLDVRNVLVGARKFIFKVLPDDASIVFLDFVLRCDTILVTYIAESFMDALIIGSVNAIFMAICKMPYIGLISVVVGVTNPRYRCRDRLFHTSAGRARKHSIVSCILPAPAERGRLYPQAQAVLERAWRIRRRYPDLHHCSREHVRDSWRSACHTGGCDPEFCLPRVLYEEQKEAAQEGAGCGRWPKGVGWRWRILSG